MDNDNQREMEPLLPLMDDDTLTILREKDLLINSDCLRLSDVVGQGRSKCIYIYIQYCKIVFVFLIGPFCRVHNNYKHGFSSIYEHSPYKALPLR